MRRKIDKEQMQNDQLDKFVVAFKSGDKTAFDAIYDSTNKAVYFAIFYILKDRTKSEDILQDTYLTAFRKIELYNEGTNFWSWIITIAKHLALNYYNRNQKELPVDIYENEKIFGTQNIDQYSNSGILEIARQSLNEDEYQILMLSEIAGYKRREISNMMNTPVSTISWKYKQALEKLRKIYQNEEDEL